MIQAEKDQVTYHSPGPFDAKTGEIIPKISEGLSPKYQDVFGETIVELARENKKIIGIRSHTHTHTHTRVYISTHKYLY